MLREHPLFVADLLTLLRNLPPLYRPRLLRIAQRYKAFGLPELGSVPAFPVEMCALPLAAQAMTDLSPTHISPAYPRDADLSSSLTQLVLKHDSVLYATFEPSQLLRPCFSAALTDFNRAVDSLPLSLEHWSDWYDDLGIFRQ